MCSNPNLRVCFHLFVLFLVFFTDDNCQSLLHITGEKWRTDMGSGLLKLFAFLQKHRTPLIITSCGGVFAANMMYHVFPEHSHRRLYQAWYKGEQVPLSEKLQALFQQVLGLF